MRVRTHTQTHSHPQRWRSIWNCSVCALVRRSEGGLGTRPPYQPTLTATYNWATATGWQQGQRAVVPGTCPNPHWGDSCESEHLKNTSSPGVTCWPGRPGFTLQKQGLPPNSPKTKDPTQSVGWVLCVCSAGPRYEFFHSRLLNVPLNIVLSEALLEELSNHSSPETIPPPPGCSSLVHCLTI